MSNVGGPQSDHIFSTLIIYAHAERVNVRNSEVLMIWEQAFFFCILTNNLFYVPSQTGFA